MYIFWPPHIMHHNYLFVHMGYNAQVKGKYKLEGCEQFMKHMKCRPSLAKQISRATVIGHLVLQLSTL